MRFLCTLLLLVAASSADHVLYNAQSGAQKGLLVLPKQDPTLSTTSTPAPRNKNEENLEYVNAKILEKLKQEPGSEQGVYHVYLQDGRLQRVQYTTAPIAFGQQAQQQQYASNNYNQQQTPEILSPDFAEKRGVYFVQVPQERIQQLKDSYNQQISQQSTQTAQGFNNFQFSQQNAQTNFQFPEPQPSSQYTQAQQDYLASIQYSPVEPIRGPVYSYKPEPLTRILRYAPAFY